MKFLNVDTIRDVRSSDSASACPCDFGVVIDSPEVAELLVEVVEVEIPIEFGALEITGAISGIVTRSGTGAIEVEIEIPLGLYGVAF